MTVRVLEGDCCAVMKTLADASVHSVVTDPPYGIGMMGAEWDHKAIMDRVAARARTAQPPLIDGKARATPRRAPAEEAGAYALSPAAMRAFQSWTTEWAREAFRVLKPGGILLCFAATRTYHRMACGLEDAGFEIFDQIGWLFGSGYPKSRDFAKDQIASNRDGRRVVRAEFVGHPMSQGFGTALKPGWEPIAVARKPLEGTYAQNVLKHGTGAFNIDGCRVPVEGDEVRKPITGRGAIPARHDASEEPRAAGVVTQPHALGRWPVNVLHDGSDEVLAAFPDAPGQKAESSFDSSKRKNQNVFNTMARGRHEASAGTTYESAGGTDFSMKPGARRGDRGSAARFFYCAKASKAEREVGLDQQQRHPLAGRANTHPTVKPTSLMRWMVRLVTPPGGIVLDPFAGSGSTGRAADIEGLDAILIERDPSYAAIARARVAGDVPLFSEIA